jgi:hypothetical protein
MYLTYSLHPNKSSHYRLQPLSITSALTMTWYPEADLDHDDTAKGMSPVRVSQSSTAGRSIDKLVEHSMIDGDRDGAAAVDDTWMELDWIVNVHD